MAELNMRKDVPLEETWDLTLLFRNREEYEEERAKARRKAEEIRAGQSLFLWDRGKLSREEMTV